MREQRAHALARRQSDADFTLGLEDEWDDVPTAQMEAPSSDEPTANIDAQPPESVVQLPRRSPVNAPAAQPAATVIAKPEAPPPAPRDITPGTLLAQRYLLGGLLGTGGSSLIFQAEDRRRIGAQDVGSRIAIKVLRPEMRNNPHALTRLQREFRQMQRLSHPGIAQVYELGRDEDVWFMSMELIDGQTINQWLKSSTTRAAGLKVIAACCDALHHAHAAGVIHGDLKPSNVLVLPDYGVKLVDFGSAAERDAAMSIIDTQRSFAATPPYASPQVLAGDAADPRDDVFSLACLAYAVLTHGQHPFERKSSADAQQAQMRPAYARGMSAREFDAIVRALSWEREQRFASVREFLHALLASDLRRDPVRDELREDTSDVSAPAAPAAVASAPEAAAKVEPPAPRQEAAAHVEAPPRREAPEFAEPVPTAEPAAAKADPLERFKGYVAGPLAPSEGHAEREVAISRSAQAEEPAAEPKKRWRWPWQRSALFALFIVIGAAIVGSQFEISAPAAPPVEARTEAPASEPAPAVAAPESETAPPPLIAETAEKKSPAIAVAPPAPSIAPGEISFTTRTLQVGAHQTLAALSVQRLHSTRGRARAIWTIEEGTARSGVHYDVDAPQTIEFLDGQSVRSVFIPLQPDDNAATARRSKTFTVKLQQAAGGPVLGEIKQVYVTIEGDVMYEPEETARLDVYSSATNPS